jgi:hypothetical protein
MRWTFAYRHHAVLTVARRAGAADTMRHRHAVPDAPCDEEIETALRATRRALYKRFLRERWMGKPAARAWPAGLTVSKDTAGQFDGHGSGLFEGRLE